MYLASENSHHRDPACDTCTILPEIRISLRLHCVLVVTTPNVGIRRQKPRGLNFEQSSLGEISSPASHRHFCRYSIAKDHGASGLGSQAVPIGCGRRSRKTLKLSVAAAGLCYAKGARKFDAADGYYVRAVASCLCNTASEVLTILSVPL